MAAPETSVTSSSGVLAFRNVSLAERWWKTITGPVAHGVSPNDLQFISRDFGLLIGTDVVNSKVCL